MQTLILAAAAAMILSSPVALHAQNAEPPPPSGATNEDRIRSGDILPPGYTPPPADPRDIEGVWLPGKLPGAPRNVPEGPSPTALGQRGPTNAASGTTLQCTPVSRLGGAGGGLSDLWVQDSHMVLMLSEEGMDVRQIHLTDAHPQDIKPQPNGHSIGHWEGDTLVVDTVAFADGQGRDLGQHVAERIRKVPNGKGWALEHRDVVTTAAGAKERVYIENWRPDLHVFESICEETFGRFLIVNGEIITPNDDPRETAK